MSGRGLFKRSPAGSNHANNSTHSSQGTAPGNHGTEGSGSSLRRLLSRSKGGTDAEHRASRGADSLAYDNNDDFGTSSGPHSGNNAAEFGWRMSQQLAIGRGYMDSRERANGGTQIQFERDDGLPLDMVMLPATLLSEVAAAYRRHAAQLAAQNLTLAPEELQAFHHLYRGHIVHARKLRGGFKSSVWACTNINEHGHACVPTIAKFAPTDELSVEHGRHHMLQYVLAQHVPRILSFVTRGTTSGMCMTNEKSGQSLETIIVSGKSQAYTNAILDQLFSKVLHRLYREARPAPMCLFEYYFMIDRPVAKPAKGKNSPMPTIRSPRTLRRSPGGPPPTTATVKRKKSPSKMPSPPKSDELPSISLSHARSPHLDNRRRSFSMIPSVGLQAPVDSSDEEDEHLSISRVASLKFTSKKMARLRDGGAGGTSEAEGTSIFGTDEDTKVLAARFKPAKLASAFPQLYGARDSDSRHVPRRVFDEVERVIVPEGVEGQLLRNFLMYGPVCYAASTDKIQIKSKARGVVVVPIVTSVLENAMRDPAVRSESVVTKGFVHGDLNARNVLVKDREQVCLIDFDNVHDGHAIRDFAKLENDLMYVLSEVDNEDDLAQGLELTMTLVSVDDLCAPLPASIPGVDSPDMHRTWTSVARLRHWLSRQVLVEQSARSYLMALLHYACKSLYFKDITECQRKWALASASVFAQRLFTEGPISLCGKILSPPPANNRFAPPALRGAIAEQSEKPRNVETCGHHDIKLLFYYLQRDSSGFIRKQDLVDAMRVLLRAGTLQAVKVEGDTVERWVARKHNGKFDFGRFESFIDTENLDRVDIMKDLITVTSRFHDTSQHVGSRSLLKRSVSFWVIAQHLILPVLVLWNSGRSFVIYLHQRRERSRQLQVPLEESFREGLGPPSPGLKMKKAATIRTVQLTSSSRIWWFNRTHRVVAPLRSLISSREDSRVNLLRTTDSKRKKRQRIRDGDVYAWAMLFPYVAVFFALTHTLVHLDQVEMGGDACGEELAAAPVGYLCLTLIMSMLNHYWVKSFSLRDTQHLKSYELLLPFDSQKISSCYNVIEQVVQLWRNKKNGGGSIRGMLEERGWGGKGTALGVAMRHGLLQASIPSMILYFVLPALWALVWPVARRLDDDLLCDVPETNEIAFTVANYLVLVAAVQLLQWANAGVNGTLQFFDCFSAITSVRMSSVLELPFIPLDRGVNVHGWMRLRSFVLTYFTVADARQLRLPIAVAGFSLLVSGVSLLVAWRLLTHEDSVVNPASSQIASIHMLLVAAILMWFALPVLQMAALVTQRMEASVEQLHKIEYDLHLRAMQVSQMHHYSAEERLKMKECATLTSTALAVALRDDRVPRLAGVRVNGRLVVAVQASLGILVFLVLRLL